MTTGFNIVIGGESFDPSVALSGCRLKPDLTFRKGESMSNGELSSVSFIEWDDWHANDYPLNMVLEALDFLKMHRQEFLKICRSPGVEYRTINFVGQVPGGGVFDLEPEQIGLLQDLGFRISIVVTEAEAKCEPGAAPNGGPAMHSGDSLASGGPPSVS